ncbi:MAG: hypothetical protein U7123_20755 [Potamolinea sp.]
MPMQARLVEVQQLLSSDSEALLLSADRHAMYSLLNTHFEGVNPELFETDLERKNWVILLEDRETKTLKGFSTLLVYETQFEGEVLTVVYSGDTIVDPSAWSSLLLPRAWIASINFLRQKYPKGKLYWLLISSGYRTYRFLPIFWKEFYPCYDTPTPPYNQALMHFLAHAYFGKCYDENAGVVRFPHPQILREKLSGIPSERLKDSHIRFFQTKNPGYEQGDELVCLAEIKEENLTQAGKRMWFAKTSL